MIAKINAEIITNPPRDLAGLNAELYDADPLSDTLLAQALVQPNGRIEFIFDTEDVADADSPFEKRPDLYVLVKDSSGNAIHRTSILQNVDFDERDPISGDRKSTLDLVFSEKPHA